MGSGEQSDRAVEVLGRRLARRVWLQGALGVGFGASLGALDLWPAHAARKKKPRRGGAAATRLAVATNLGVFEIATTPKTAPKLVANLVALARGQQRFTDPKTREAVKRPFYDGLSIHRAIPGVLIQGGCPLGDGKGTPGYVLPDEINADALGLGKERVLDASGTPSARLLIASEDDFYTRIVDPLIARLAIKNPSELERRQQEVDAKIRALTIKEAYENLGYVYTAAHPTPPITRGVVAMANSGPNTNGSQFLIALKPLPVLDGKHTPVGVVSQGLDVVDTIAALGNAQQQPKRAVTMTSVKVVGRARSRRSKR